MKHEPKTMKAKADLMHKRGSISEKERDRLHKKADVEIAKAKKPKAIPADDDSEAGPEATADATQTPKGRKAAIRENMTRGQPVDEEEKDL